MMIKPAFGGAGLCACICHGSGPQGRWPHSALLIAMSLGVFAMPAARADSAHERLYALFTERYQWQLREFPEYAMCRGVYDYADHIADHSLAAFDRRHEQTKDLLNRLHAIPRNELNDDDRLNYDLFDTLIGWEVEGQRFRTFLAAIGARDGLHQDVPQMHERVRFHNYTDYANYLKRLQQVPQAVRQVTERLRAGMKEGRTAPQVALAGVPSQFHSLLEGGGLREIAKPFENTPAGINEQQKAELKRQFESQILPLVEKALRDFGEFVTKEYLPACRHSIAAADWPDGREWYAFALRTHSTTDLSAEQIHAIGLREVERIRQEMMQVIRRTDFVKKFPVVAELDDQRLFKSFIHYLRTDARFYCKSEDELLTRYRDICKRVDAGLPKLFGKLPRLPYGVRKIPDFMAPNQTTAYYQQGDIRNAEPGYFYANTYALDQRGKYEMISLAMHEAVPGHHLQIALAQELENTPEFRKDAWFTAFGEGWALYSERLGIEMGLYEDPYDDFGRLLYEMWRACRLVVDPGMHALGWSRERAVQFMLDNTALSEVNINAEIDRYIAWPGQAVAYKLGELKIRELRERAEKSLGATFDLRDFHDVALSAGTIPLNVLERRIDAWIASKKPAASAQPTRQDPVGRASLPADER